MTWGKGSRRFPLLTSAASGVNRVGGLNLKGVFTRTRQPKLAAHVLREFWVER